MAVQLTCPNCQSTLRAPDNSAGKKVRCKKCEHKFRVPGADAVGDSIAEDQALSVVDMQSPLPPVSARAPAVAAAVPAGAGPAASFSFEEEGAMIKPSPASTRGKRSSMMMKTANGKGGGEPEVKSNKGLIIALVGMLLVAMLGMAGIAAYFLLGKGDKAVASAPGSGKEKEKKGTDPAPSDGGGKKIDTRKLYARWEFVSTDPDMTPTVAEYTNKGMCHSYIVKGDKATPLASIPIKVDGNKISATLDNKEYTSTITKLTDEDLVITDAKGGTQTYKKLRRNIQFGPPPKDPPVKDPPIKDPPPKSSGGGFTIPTVAAGGKLVAKPQLDIMLDAETPAVRAVVTGGRDPAVAMVLWNSFGGFGGKGGRDTVTRYSLAAKNEIGKIDVPAADWATGPKPIACSPDGNKVALESPPGKLTVYDFEEKAMVVEKVDPFGAGPRVLAGIQFVDPTTVAVIDKQGGIDVWNLKEKSRKAVVGGTGKDVSPVACVSGSDLYVHAGTELKVYKGPTLAAGGSFTVAPAGLTITPLSVTVNPAGTKAAVVFKADTDPASALVIVPLAGGKTSVYPLPDAFGDTADVAWLGQVIAVTSGKDGRAAAVLYDEEQFRPTLYLKAAGSGTVKQFHSAPTAKMLWVTPPPLGVAGKSVLVGVSPEFDEYRRIAGPALADRTIGGKPVHVAPAPNGLLAN